MTTPHPFPPADRCPGWGAGTEDWLEECAECQRRGDPEESLLAPPLIVSLWCENQVPPDRPEDQRLRQLAQEYRKSEEYLNSKSFNSSSDSTPKGVFGVE